VIPVKDGWKKDKGVHLQEKFLLRMGAFFVLCSTTWKHCQNLPTKMMAISD